jgi:outer membrane protein assembly factor BamB
MSDAPLQNAITCRWCGAENQTPWQPCGQCDRYIVELPRWAEKLPSQQKWFNRKRAIRIAAIAAVLTFLVWLNYPFMPEPVILLFKKPTTDLSSASQPGQWSMMGWDHQKTRYVPQVPSQPKGEVLWSRPIGTNTLSAPTVADGVIYMGAHFRVIALDADTGNLIWERDATGPVHSSPAVAGDSIYLGFLDHRIMAMDRSTGETRWQIKTEDAVSASPTVSKGIVYVGGWDGITYALDASSGEVIWKAEGAASIHSDVAIDDGLAYTTDTEGNLYILNARTGQKRHRFRTPGGNTDSPVAANGLAYFTSAGKIYAVDAKAREIPGELQLKKVWAQFWLWQVPGVPRPPGQKGGKWRFSPDSKDAGIISPPAVADTVLYAGDTHGIFYARDGIKGSEVWRFQADGAIIASPVVLGDVVYFGTRKGSFYALDRSSGELIWQLSLGAPIEAPPAFAQGRFYVRTTDGQLHAIQ